MTHLAPSILDADFNCLGEQIKELEKNGIKYLHLDIMDGHFVPNITFGPLVIKKIRRHSKLIFNSHLMIENPERYLEDFIIAGTDIVTVHCEACAHLHRTLQIIKEKGKKAGVALNPATPLIQIKHILELADLVLIMSVNPGFGGQKFIDSSLEKIKELKEIKEKKGYDFFIEVDGGIKPDNALQVVEAGADILVSGSAIFKDGCIKDNLQKFKMSLSLVFSG